MADCSNQVLSKCLNPQPLPTHSWKGKMTEIFQSTVHGGSEIAKGVVVDSFWSFVNAPTHAFKYILGVDKNLGQGNPWSLSGLFKHYSWSLEGNPVYRVADTAVYIVYGGINTVLGGIPHQVFNERFKMGIIYFAPPPKPGDLRGNAHWVTMGVLTLSAASAIAKGSAPAGTKINRIAAPQKNIPVHSESVFSSYNSSYASQFSREGSAALDIPYENIAPGSTIVEVPNIAGRTLPAKPPQTARLPFQRHPLPNVYQPTPPKFTAVTTETIQDLFNRFLKDQNIKTGFEGAQKVPLGKNIEARIIAEPFSNRVQVSVFKARIDWPIAKVLSDQFGNILSIDGAAIQTGLSKVSVARILKSAFKKGPNNPLLKILDIKIGNILPKFDRLEFSLLKNELRRAIALTEDFWHHHRIVTLAKRVQKMGPKKNSK